MPEMRMLRTLLGLVPIVAACADAASIRSIGPNQPKPNPNAPMTTRIREDFDNSGYIGVTHGVIIDFNQGLAELATQVFPDISGDQVVSYSGDMAVGGIVQASQIVLDGNSSLSASDSIELRAQDLLRVTGDIHAGSGGVTLEAGNQMIIDGRIESQGPVKLLIGSEMGTIQIDGEISANSAMKDRSSGVTIQGRGSVTITGAVTAVAEVGLASGDVNVYTYGPITITGLGAKLTAAARQQGTTGNISLRSESDVVVNGGAWVGGEDLSSVGIMPLPSTGLVGAGGIDVEAAHVSLQDGGRIRAASASMGDGGSVHIAASAALDMSGTSSIASGGGYASGAVQVEVASASLGDGTAIIGGTGVRIVRPLLIESSGMMSLGAGASIVGGIGACAAGGDANVHVGQQLAITPGGSIQGGSSGSHGSGFSCNAAVSPGGNVEVIAAEAIGLQGAVHGGAGSMGGQVSVNIDPSYTLPPPNLTVTTHGWIESRSIDRGAMAVGLSPVLIGKSYTVPSGTAVKIELAGSSSESGPFDTWIDTQADAPVPLDALASARFFHYRMTLAGRAYDTPIVDYFEIDLAPR
jgi:hypothetical protein